MSAESTEVSHFIGVATRAKWLHSIQDVPSKLADVPNITSGKKDIHSYSRP